jgi:hypothetical protein
MRRLLQELLCGSPGGTRVALSKLSAQRRSPSRSCPAPPSPAPDATTATAASPRHNHPGPGQRAGGAQRWASASRRSCSSRTSCRASDAGRRDRAADRPDAHPGRHRDAGDARVRAARHRAGAHGAVGAVRPPQLAADRQVHGASLAAAIDRRPSGPRRQLHHTGRGQTLRRSPATSTLTWLLPAAVDEAPSRAPHVAQQETSARNRLPSQIRKRGLRAAAQGSAAGSGSNTGIGSADG